MSEDIITGKIKRGKLKLLFQPGEETLKGALSVIDDGVLDDVDIALGLHVRPATDIPEGTVAAALMHSASIFVRIDVEGFASHASRPHLGVNCAEMLAAIVQNAGLLKFAPTLTWSMKCTKIEVGGAAANVIPDKVEVLGTVRTHDNALRRRIFELIDEKSEAICALYGCSFHRDKTWNGLPVLVNDLRLTRFVEKNAARLLGSGNVVPMDYLTLGEDFAIYLEKIPGAFWVLGVRPLEMETMAPLHNPHMSPSEEALRIGMALMVENCVRFLAGGE